MTVIAVMIMTVIAHTVLTIAMAVRQIRLRCVDWLGSNCLQRSCQGFHVSHGN